MPPSLRTRWLRTGLRLGEAILLCGFVVVLAFVVTRLMPGDPVAVITDGNTVDPELAQRLRDAGGISQSLWRQFADYLAHLAQGDLGLSWRYGGTPVTTLIAEAAPGTLLLAASALILATPAGIIAGVASARRAGQWLDGAITVSAVLALSLPPVVVATWLTLLSAFCQKSLPMAEGGGLAALILPVIALSIAPAGIISRLTRAQLLEVLGQEYVQCARAKGLRESTILIRHALPNALVSVATVVGTLAGTILTSTAVIETVFNLPGLGRLAVFSVLSRDYPLAGGVIMVFVLIQVAISLVVDVLISAIDPRTRTTADLS